jgi:hypothetical protein
MMGSEIQEWLPEYFSVTNPEHDSESVVGYACAGSKEGHTALVGAIFSTSQVDSFRSPYDAM